MLLVHECLHHRGDDRLVLGEQAVHARDQLVEGVIDLEPGGVRPRDVSERPPRRGLMLVLIAEGQLELALCASSERILVVSRIGRRLLPNGELLLACICMLGVALRLPGCFQLEGISTLKLKSPQNPDNPQNPKPLFLLGMKASTQTCIYGILP